jgi:hypothetical protein
MFFWSIRLLLLVSALPFMFVRWRVAVGLLFAALVDFVTLLGMTLPAFGIWGEFLFVFPVSLVLGIVLSLGKQVSRVPSLVCLSALVVLHVSPYLDGLATGETHAAVVVQRLPALSVLLLAVTLGFELPLLGRRLFKVRRNRQVK